MQLTSTLCTHFRLHLTAALLETAGEMKVPEWVSNSEPLAHDSDALETLLRSPALIRSRFLGFLYKVNL